MLEQQRRHNFEPDEQRDQQIAVCDEEQHATNAEQEKWPDLGRTNWTVNSFIDAAWQALDAAASPVESAPFGHQPKGHDRKGSAGCLAGTKEGPSTRNGTGSCRAR